MKRFLITIFILAFLVMNPSFGALTNSVDVDASQITSYWWTGEPLMDVAWLWSKEVENILEGTTAIGKIYMDPTDTVPTAVEGVFYYNDSGNTLELCTSASGAGTWVSIDTAGASSLDTAYGISAAVTVDGDAITLTAGASTNNGVLTLVQSNTGAYECLKITNAGTDPSIEIDGSGTGDDITGTGDLWTVSEAGVGTFAGLIVGGTDIVMENADTFMNEADDVFEFHTNDKEDFEIDLSGTNIVKFDSDTEAVTLELDSLDDVNGVGNIYFDSAASQITLAANAAADDLLVQVTGAFDASLDLRSAGTGTDAVKVYASAGGIDVDATNDIAITVTSSTAGEDLLLTQTGANASAITVTAAGTGDPAIALQATAGGIDVDAAKSVNIASSEDTTDAIRLSASAGGIDIDAVGAAAQDISILNTGGSMILSATEDIADAIYLHATTGGIDITADGAAAKDIDIICTNGSVNLWAGENIATAMVLEVDSDTASVLKIFNDTGTSVTEGAASIEVLSDAGGIELRSTANLANAISLTNDGGTTGTIQIYNDQGSSTTEKAASIQLLSDDGSIELWSGLNAADAINIMCDGNTGSGIMIFNDTGTSVTEGASSIQLLSDVGGIGLESNANLAKSIWLIADGGISETILVESQHGTGVASIELQSDAGGITLNAAKPVVITNAFEPDIVHVPDGAAYDVLANNSGQIHIIPDQSADITLDLPAEADGLHYRFVYVGGAADSQDWLIDSESNTNYFVGGIVQHDPDAGGDDTTPYYSDGNSNSIIGVLTPECGTVIEIWCDGTNWYVTGTVISATDTGVTFSDQAG